MRAAWSFLTCLGGPASPTPRALPWFPVVGAGLGLALGSLWWAIDAVWASLLAAAVVVALDQAVTGMLHLDGLADSADGLLAHDLDTSRRLAVMAEPATGAFAVGTVTLVLVVRVSALAALVPSPVLLAVLWATSRAAMALTVLTQPYVRRHGLVSRFRDPTSGPGPVVVVSVVWALVLVAGGGAAMGDRAGMAVGSLGAGAVGAILAAVATVALARRRIGGYTGDVLGAAGMVAETAGLVAAAARW